MAKVEKFSPEDLEYIQVIINLMENVLGLKKKVILIFDEKLFNKYVVNKITRKKTWGSTIRESSIIWLDEKALAKQSRAILAHIIIHEMLHIAFPLKSEAWVVSATKAYIDVRANSYYK